MKIKNIFLLFVLMLVLSGCAECKKAADCEQKSHFTSACFEKTCQYTSIPYECGNDICEKDENKCSCPVDCGICQGKKSLYTELQCINAECVETTAGAKPVVLSSDVSSAGSKFRITSEFNQPFNLKRDLFNLKFSILSKSATTKDVKLSKIILTGRTKDKRVIQMAEKDIEKYLWYGGEDLKEKLILDFPVTEEAGDLVSLELTVNFDYTYISGSLKAQKSSSMKIRYTNVKEFKWINPKTEYSCPKDCDDDNPGTLDECSAMTNFFCTNTPMINFCGNFICEPGENPCICKIDCGPCAGGGAYTNFVCIEDKCVAQLKPGMTVTPSSIFDERNMNYFHMQNNYKFNNPFNTATDKIELKFNLYDKKTDISNIKITDIRLFEGVNEIAFKQANVVLPEINSFQTIEVEIPSQAVSETEKSLGLKVWYEFQINAEMKKGSYTKPLGKILLISPV